jgi:hypothetical protein
MKKIISILPSRFKWSIHNLLAHPISEILFQIGFENLGNRLHDCTIPDHKPEEGRG